MGSSEIERLARRIVSLERKQEALARSPQLPHSSVSVPGVGDVSISDGVSGGASSTQDLYDLQVGVEDSDYTLGQSIEAAVQVPNWIDNSTDPNWDSAQQAIDMSRTAQSKADQVADDVLEVALEAADALEKANLAVVNTLDEYAVSDSSSVPPTSGWSDDTPDWEDGLFVWRRVKSTLANGTIEYGSPAVMTGSSGEDAVLLRVYSTRGTVFKNNSISTQLTVTVFKGSDQITDLPTLRDTFGMSSYLEWWWRRVDDSAFGVISSVDPRLSAGGFTLTVSPADVDEQTVFQCILHT